MSGQVRNRLCYWMAGSVALIAAPNAGLARDAVDPDPLVAASAAAPGEETQAPETAVPGDAPRATPRWNFTVMPYVWASGLGGEIRPFAGAPTVTIDESFGDLLESVDGAVFVSFAAERETLVLLGDFSRVATSREGVLPGGIPTEGGTRQTTLTLAVGHRAVARPDVVVDVFAGVRGFDLRARAQVVGGPVIASPSRTFVDPLVGARAIVPLSPRWSTMVYADVGGFGAGSEFTVVASAMLNYRVSRIVTLSGGYRSMWLDYDGKGTVADVTLAGPVLGAAFRF